MTNNKDKWLHYWPKANELRNFNQLSEYLFKQLIQTLIKRNQRWLYAQTIWNVDKGSTRNSFDCDCIVTKQTQNNSDIKAEILFEVKASLYKSWTWWGPVSKQMERTAYLVKKVLGFDTREMKHFKVKIVNPFYYDISSSQKIDINNILNTGVQFFEHLNEDKWLVVNYVELFERAKNEDKRIDHFNKIERVDSN